MNNPLIYFKHPIVVRFDNLRIEEEAYRIQSLIQTVAANTRETGVVIYHQIYQENLNILNNNGFIAYYEGPFTRINW